MELTEKRLRFPSPFPLQEIGLPKTGCYNFHRAIHIELHHIEAGEHNPGVSRGLVRVDTHSHRHPPLQHQRQEPMDQKAMLQRNWEHFPFDEVQFQDACRFRGEF